MDDRNPLVASGEYERVFVCELESGDINAFGEKIARVDAVGDAIGAKVRVIYENGRADFYGKRSTTILVKVR